MNEIVRVNAELGKRITALAEETRQKKMQSAAVSMVESLMESRDALLRDMERNQRASEKINAKLKAIEDGSFSMDKNFNITFVPEID